MTVITQGKANVDFILTEANGQRSRDNDTLKAGSGVLVSGTVLQRGQDNLLVPFDGTSDSSGGLDVQAAAILLYNVDASGASNIAVSVLTRDAEVNKHQLVYASTEAEVIASLKTVGIIAR